MSDIEKILTHEEDALDRVLLQYAEANDLKSLISISAARIQELETIFCDLLEQRNINDATGATQDIIGEIVGQDRSGFSDEFYENLLKAKVGENTSEGDIEKIISIVKLLTGANSVHLQEWYPLGIGIGVDVEVDPALINFLYERLNRVDAATVRVEQIWCFDDSEAFAFDGNQSNALGFGDVNDSSAGGQLASLHLKTKPSFAFAAESGVDNGDEGYSSIDDVYVGGFLIGI